NREENQGKLGVFWHTQGSGKSYSMQFLSQKVKRKLPGNWTFLIITDREDLDGQIYQNFAQTGAVNEAEKTIRASSGEHLQRLLREDHSYIFTLIQKFRSPKTGQYPQLSTRDDIIVIADEAHRSQYDIFAHNLRLALPKAAFIGFTGTPLLVGEEATKAEFGDYISIYNFRQSIADGATVPLFYENRIPQLQLTNQDLDQDIAEAIETADLDEEQENRLVKEFSRQYNLITTTERLTEIAADIVSHFLNRGYQGKAMVIAIDRFTAVSMYNKVQSCWQQELGRLKALPTDPAITKKIAYLEATDMAVVISASPNEETAFQERGLNIKPHRQRLTKEKPSLEEKFKDQDHPLRIVFVCAMWITGFDVPSCSTIYLDKPMANHTLMQTIARANRVCGTDKLNGLIVDYIGIFRNLQQALAIYGSGDRGDDTPVKPKTELVAQLREKITEAKAFCQEHQVNFEELQRLGDDSYDSIALWDNFVNSLLATEASKQQFLAYTRDMTKLYRAILPDVAAREFRTALTNFLALAKRIHSHTPQADIRDIKAEIRAILDESIGTLDYVIPETGEVIDLSQLDFEALQKQFQQGYKHIEVEKLKTALGPKLGEMVQLNKTRLSYLERYEQMIEEYNAGSRNIETFFEELIELCQALNQEEQRAITENLDEEHLALFDILTQPDLNLTKQEKAEVKRIACELLETLKQEKLVLDWRKRQQSRAAVKVTIEDALEELPETYTDEDYEGKSHQVYQHIYESYFGNGHSIYHHAA
ncbi:MAG: type I restriction endonuclease subunit R, partial [Symploca sp. SIO2D2]|nr:type I restriction endonuclease subunit R [Symploca sp. SIO2D2]